MKKVTYFDVEYANSKNKSICQMGIMCENFEDGEPIFPELDLYINPDDGFDTVCTQIHGICANTVKNAPIFPDVWVKVEKYFTNSIIVGHNVAAADLDALVKQLNRYNIDIPEFYYVDTLEIARDNVLSCYVNNYSMSSLCAYFKIAIDNEHNAFDDACACADLLKALIKKYSLSLDDYVKRYLPHESAEHIRYIANPIIRKSISDFYGVITGIVIDKKIKPKEYEYIKEWRNANKQYDTNRDIKVIIDTLDIVIADGVITATEMGVIKIIIGNYLERIKCSQITLATQVLAGIMKGITCDKEITDEECMNLSEWLYNHNYLRGHFPYDKIIETLDTVLADNFISQEEAKTIFTLFNELLNPVEILKGEIYSVKEKKVCLSGVFAYGQKSAVADYIAQRGGFVEETVNRGTDFLIVGDYECEAYSNGTYGSKVKKAIEYNKKGCNITILKEKDFFNAIK